MNYIYDIVLNFNKEYYPFYEWDIEDNIINIRKIPLFRVRDETYIDIKNYNITIDKTFIEDITNKTELYLETKLPYKTFLITSCKEVMGIMLDDEGNIKALSSLLFEEEDEALELASTLPEKTLIYTKTSKKEHKKIICRKEKERCNKLTKLIKDLQNYGNYSALKYIYYDLFEKESNDIKKIKETIIKEIKTNKLIQEKLENIFIKSKYLLNLK